MTTTQVTILAAVIASPLLVAAFDWARNKVSARFSYRGWQAIFLANGHVYFGKVSSINRSDLTVKDIYYLNDPEGPFSPRNVTGGEGAEIHLIKLGSELHGPKDSMVISRATISFTEGLKEDGQVVQAIAKHKKEGESHGAR